MDIDNLTIKELKAIQALALGQSSPQTSPWQIGKNYLIRTVTMIDTGRLVGVSEHELVLEDAAWIADTGRFTQALTSCSFSEVEMFPSGQVIIGRASVIDAVVITTLPSSQK